jgi:hypothetical protein
MSGYNAVQVELFVNKNALETVTFIGSTAYGVMDSPFVVVEEVFPTDATEQNGLPTFGASLTGIAATDAYFLLDFNADRTIVWNTNCMTTGFGNYAAGSCEY